MRIAIIGTRGVPALYSGFEACAEEVGARLAERGHEVIAYCRPGYADDTMRTYRGIRRVVLPSLKFTATDTYSHSLVSMLHVLGQKPDVVLAFNPGIATLCVIPKVFGIPVVLNPNGFDWLRPKWGRFARFFIRRSAWLSTRITDRIITDSHSITRHYNDDFNSPRPAIHIPNGAAIVQRADLPLSEEEEDAILASHGVERGKYFLFLSRHVPDNSCVELIEAYEGLETDFKLVFGGDDNSTYARELRNTDDERILFPGKVMDPFHEEVLHLNCYAVLHGNQPGGTSLGLLKAMGYGACVATLNTPDNAHVIGDTGVTYNLDARNIQQVLEELLSDPQRVRRLGDSARARIAKEYGWDGITDQYEALFRDILDGA